ncbi:MAG: cbb3-type cytochrome c oxidase subunit II [Planctomycetaceae bacterium]|nr:cbb3-type cytochrome c oxidase subunit II [Planctomycetaceae bacterium]
MFESKSGVFFIAGLFFFVFAFLSNALVPILMYQHLPEQTALEVVNANARYQFEDLAQRYPEQFKQHIGTPPEDLQEADKWYDEQCAEMLKLGRDIYVGEGCWHCHSQFVRPVSNEEERWGPVSRSEEYQNELQRPVLFGTRRVGPDLCREGGRRSNDWHAVHFFKPESLSQGSPMPEYPWFFDGTPDKPNARGLAIMTYIQWLGSWQQSYPYYEAYVPSALQAPVAADETDAAE